MSAIIEVSIAGTDSSQVWIEKPFLTIGSGPSFDISIPSQIEGQIASVRFRDGTYMVFNQLEPELTVNGVKVLQGTSHAWNSGTRLTFPDVAELQLVIKGDPAPSRRKPIHAVVADEKTAKLPPPSETESLQEEVKSNTSNPPSKGNGRTEIIQAAVILVCVIGCILILTINGMPSAEEAKSEDYFTQIVQLAETQNADGAPIKAKISSNLLNQVQSAEYSARRSDFKVARIKLARLRAYLAKDEKLSRPPENGEQPDTSVLLQKYVESQLAKLPAQ